MTRGEEHRNSTVALARGRAPGRSRQARVVCNVRAAHGATSAGVALRVFARYDLECRVEIPQPATETCSMVREGRRRFDVVVIEGGDDTLRAALHALRGTGAPVGILPCGAAGGFARTIGVPRSVEKAAEPILAGQVRWIDVGWVNGRPLLNGAHIGVGAWARDGVSGARKRRLGPWPTPLDPPWETASEKVRE